MVDSGKPKHTPGPWYAISDGPVAKLFNSTVIVSEQIDDAIICSIGRDVPGDEANVSLITAAPDMLKALQKIADNYGGCHCDHSTKDCCENSGEFCPHCIAELAICKAVGDGR